MKNNLAKNTILLSIGTLLTKGINLLMIPLFSSWLSTADYGSFDLYCTYISLLVPFISLSSSDAIFRLSIDKNDHEKIKYVSNSLVINLFNFGIIIVILSVIGVIFKWKFAIPFIILLITELFNNHLQGFVRCIKKLKNYSIAGVISTVGIALSVSILILKFHFGLCGIIYGYAIGNMFGILFIIFSTKYYRFVNLKEYNKKYIKNIVDYSFPLIPNSISWWIINVSDRTIINIFLGVASNGIYAIAYKIPNFCSSVFSTFSISWQEAAIDAENFEQKDKYYNNIYNKTIFTMISLCGGLLALNYFLFKFVFNSRYFDARLFCPILVLSVIFSSLTQFFGGIQISLKQTKENGSSTLVGAIVNVFIDILLIKFIGLYAAAISTLISNIVICYIRFLKLKNYYNFKLNKKTIACIFYLIYLFVMSYIFSNLYLSIFNLILSIICFIIINIEFVKKIFYKFKILKRGV